MVIKRNILFVAGSLHRKSGTDFNLEAAGQRHLTRGLNLIFYTFLYCDVASCAPAVNRTARRQISGINVLGLIQVGVLEYQWSDIGDEIVLVKHDGAVW